MARRPFRTPVLCPPFALAPVALTVWALIIVGCGGSPKIATREASSEPAVSPTRSPERRDESKNKLQPPSMESESAADDLLPNERELQTALEAGKPTSTEVPANVASSIPTGDPRVPATTPESSAHDPPNQDPPAPIESGPLHATGGLSSADAIVTEPAFRILLPTTSGPLTADVTIRIDDESLQAAFDDRIQSVIEEATDPESKLTWQRLFEHVAGDPQQFGRGAPVLRQQYKDLIQRYDLDRDKKPDHNEVAKFLFRDSGFAGPFRLAGSDHFRETNRSKSAVFAAIDLNDNRQLEAEEIDLAGESIRMLDRNADGRIDFNEVVTFPGGENPAWKKRRSSRWGEVATDLAGYVDWTMVSYTLDGVDPRGPFGQPKNAIARLDQNENDSLEVDEAKELLNIPPDISLSVQFSNGGKPAKIEITAVSDEMAPLVECSESDSSVAINGATLRMTASIADGRTGRNQIPPEAFAMLDANNDGGLDEREIPAPALRDYSFEDLDQDNDGKLTLHEINEGLRPKSPIWNVQVRARGAESPDAVFAWLDQNQDQFLSTREVMAAGGHLREIASDGIVTPASLPDSFLLQFGRGEPSQDETLFQLARPKTDPQDKRPRWAQSMDVNRDGDISRHEFPGSSGQFQDLDADGDGFVSTHEVLVN